jgi:hypothetical protein
MKNLNFQFVARKILCDEPSDYILTEALGKSVSCGFKKEHNLESCR